MTTTIERINQLAEERSRLYRQAANGSRGDATVRFRVQQIDLELARLWDLRRAERAGRHEGIDALVDHVYEQTYGRTREVRIGPGTEALPTAA